MGFYEEILDVASLSQPLRIHNLKVLTHEETSLE